jgi:hypothetical protein
MNFWPFKRSCKHEFSVWGELQEEHTVDKEYDVNTFFWKYFCQHYQERKCLKCGAIERRYVGNKVLIKQEVAGHR